MIWDDDTLLKAQYLGDKAGGSGVQGYPLLCSEFEFKASPNYNESVSQVYRTWDKATPPVKNQTYKSMFVWTQC